LPPEHEFLTDNLMGKSLALMVAAALAASVSMAFAASHAGGKTEDKKMEVNKAEEKKPEEQKPDSSHSGRKIGKNSGAKHHSHTDDEAKKQGN
jgi:hypothetical protein